MKNTLKSRFWEIDFLRGLAVIIMIIYHIFFNLNIFGDYSFNTSSGLWLIMGRTAAIVFLTLVGISLYLSCSREIKLFGKKPPFIKFFKKGVTIFSWGLIITLLTWIFIRDNFIIFGILHLIGLSIIISYPILKLQRYNLFFAVPWIFGGFFLRKQTFNYPSLLWLGFIPGNYSSYDYYPLLPWFGFVLLGISLGDIFYRNYVRKINLPDYSNLVFIKEIAILGHYSLLIYLIHQPIIILILQLTGLINLT